MFINRVLFLIIKVMILIGGTKMDNVQARPDYKIERGPLVQTYGLFVPATINTGAQISADRIGEGETAKDLRGTWFYTANASFATKRNGKLLLGIGGNFAFNVVFGTDTEVVFVDPVYMALIGSDADFRYFPIRTGSYDNDVTVARMPFVSAGYGSGYMLGR